MKGPADGAGGHVVRTDVARRRRQALAHRAADDEHVLEDHAGRARTHRETFHRTIEAGAEIDVAVIAEGLDRLPGALVERPELVPVREEDAVVVHQDAAMAETGATSPKDMGKVMKAVMTRLAGMTVDGRTLSEAVKQRLGGK